MPKPKPIIVHIRAIAACAVLLGIACAWSWKFPFSTLHFSRLDSDRVDCHIEQHLLGLIVFRQIQLTDVQRISLSHDRGHRGAGGLHYLSLAGENGNDTLINASSSAGNSVKKFEAFRQDTTQTDLRLWAMPLFGYATALVAVPALLLTLAVVWDMIASQVAWLTHAPEQLVIEDSSIGDKESTDGVRE